jgi:hypothetical protein
MTARLTRWREDIERVALEVLENQPHFTDLCWEFTVDFRQVHPTQPAVPVGHLIIMAPSLLLGSPPLLMEASIPMLGQPPDAKLKEYLEGLIRAMVEARQAQVAEQAKNPTMINNVGPPQDRYTINGTGSPP